MNIKKVYILVLCIALSLCISISIFAEVNLDDFAYYADDGSLQYDMDAYYYAYAQDLVLHSGVDIDPSNYWIVSAFSGEIVGYNYDLFKADYDSVIASLAPEPIESSSVSEPIVEDVSVDNISIEDNADDDLNYDTPIESEDISVPDLLETTENNTELEYREDTPMVYLVNDLRSGSVSSSTPDIEVDLTGTLKDLIISIFGEYEPILTPTTFTETIDNVTTTTIIDAVASGSAGVDWEWCAGVFLFGIMLFCLFKLLGGIIS